MCMLCDRGDQGMWCMQCYVWSCSVSVTCNVSVSSVSVTWSVSVMWCYGAVFSLPLAQKIR